MTRARRDLAQAKVARDRLTATLGEIQERLNPRNLMLDAWSDLRTRGDEAAGSAIDLVRNRPGATAGVIAGLAVVALRHPIGRSLAKLFFRTRETETADGKLNAVNAPQRSARPRRRTAASDKGE